MASDPSRVLSDRKDFCCSFCHREFGRLEHLQRHIRRHTHEKPYDCSCGALFSRRDLLRRHERIVHGVINHTADQRSRRPRAERTAPTARSIRNQSSHLDQLLQANDNASERISVNNITSRNNISLASPTTSEEHVNHVASAQPHSQRPDIQPRLQGHSIFPAPQIAIRTQILPYFSHPVVTDSQRATLLQAVEGSVLSELSLPSTSALTRYLAGYFTGFYPQVPFTHAPTFRFETCTPELSLAILTVGALYRHEFHSAVKLFSFAKALLLERQRQEDKAAIVRLAHSTGDNMPVQRNYIDEIQTLLCLGWFATWQKDVKLRNELHELRSLLAHSLTLSGLEDVPHCSLVWEVWAQQESERRTKLLAFCFLNIQVMAYDMPPVVWGRDMNMRLPCSCPEWTAPEADTWALLQQTVPTHRDRFPVTLKGLLSASEQSDLPSNLTPVANYVLLHGLIQNIMSNQNIIEGLGVTPPVHFQSLFQNALSRWTICWQYTPESNLEPTDPNGPLPFISSTLLSFAYIRNCSSIALGHHRDLLPWESDGTADILRVSSPVKRSGDELLAAEGATHILESLVRLGIQYIQNHQPSVWNIEAALCSFECFLFLGKWLRALQLDIQHNPLTDSEASLLKRIQAIVREGLESIQGSYEGIVFTQLDVLADQIMKIGSHAMRGNSPWPYIRMIGDVLDKYNLAER